MRREALEELRKEQGITEKNLRERLKAAEAVAEATVDQAEAASVRLEVSVLTAQLRRHQERSEKALSEATQRWAEAKRVAEAQE